MRSQISFEKANASGLRFAIVVSRWNDAMTSSLRDGAVRGLSTAGDIFAGTVVIRERTDEAPTFAETFSNPIADAAFRRVQDRTDFQANVSVLHDNEIEVVESFLRRRWDLTERQRLWMAWRVALPLMFKLKPNYDLTTFTYEGFLEELLHKYHARRRYLN